MSDSTLSAEQIFFEAIQLPPGDRIAFIRNACGDDTEMLTELRELIDSHELNESDNFILGRPEPGSDSPDVAEIAESEGDRIGRYRLLELIGEGGMGRVYMAEQTEGVRRRVALKIIKLGMDTRQIIARFEAERQAMALFEHPCITRVFDTGATSTGRPYFVMELVRGSSITDYVAGNQLSLKQRLELFVEVCRAVQHAHQKGVIHRDLKPSNILVTQFDGVPVPKVIDFGIAKAIGQQQLTDKTLFTRYASMVGTPQYMSPEQAEMTGLDIDTRTDIYSLGVILYELITGSTPLDAAKLRPLNLLALYETLRDANIETPSTRLMRQSKSTSVAKPGDIQKPITIHPDRLKGGLDWVVMKALARDREMRFESASDLAADIERYLEGDPVNAAPPSRLYLLKTVLRKYRRTAAGVMAFATALLFAAVACSWLAVNNYRTSQRLADSNEQLEAANETLHDTIEQLQVAESTIRKTAERDKYSSAISMAMIQFDVSFSREVEKVLENLPLESRTHFFESELMPNEGDSNSGVMSIVFAGPGFGTDHAKLLELSQAELLSSAIEPVRTCFEEQVQYSNEVFDATVQRMDQAVFSDEALPIDDSGASWVEPAILDTEEAFERSKHKFFRFLVQEYRRVFGESDPRVAEALNLLANCLLDTSQLDEADARLRESISIADPQDKKIARALLILVQNKQREVLIQSESSPKKPNQSGQE